MNLDYVINTCKKYNITNYKINSDMTIDVYDNVSFYLCYLDEIPLMFNKIDGWLDLSHNNLKNLIGTPKEIKLNIYCYENPLESLDGFNLPFCKLKCDDKQKLIRKQKLNKFLDILK